MRFELKSLQEKIGITTIFVTHDQEEALTKVVFMTYLGAQVMYLVEIRDGQIFKVSRPTPTGVADYRIGDKVYISWNSDQIVCLRCYE